ncbi:hypothetical protein PInf_007760 [Phytophthora infestans]|nr:hypothetical protein PInf_007760 [Phytophthora infestans]
MARPWPKGRIPLAELGLGQPVKSLLPTLVVGVAESVFLVRVDESDSVDDLKEAVEAKKKNDLKDVDANKLQLFLAKTADDKWLSSRLEDVTKLKKGEKTALIEALTKKDKELQGEDSLEDVLIGMDPPSTS